MRERLSEQTSRGGSHKDQSSRGTFQRQEKAQRKKCLEYKQRSMSQSIKCSYRTKWEASCVRTVREGKDMNRHPMEGGPIDATYKTTLAQRDKVTRETTCVKWLDHTAWPSLTRKRRVLGNELWSTCQKSILVMYLSIALDVLEHCPEKGLQVTLCSPLASLQGSQSSVQPPSPGFLQC